MTAEAGGSNPNRTFSYYVGIQGYNQHFPFGTWNSYGNLNPNGINSYGLQAQSEVATLLGGLAYNGYPLDFNDAKCTASGIDCGAVGQFLSGPYAACQNGGANGGIAVGYTQANPGPFGGACVGYGPWNSYYLSNEFERDNVVNLHFAIPHKNDSGRDDLQLLYDNSMQYQLVNSSINENGGLPYISGFLNQFSSFATAPWAGTNVAGLCGYENFFMFGCAQTNSPLEYIDSKIFAPGTSFGQAANTAVVNPYPFPNSPTNRAINNPFTGDFPSGLPTDLQDGFWNNVGIVKAQYTKNIGSNAYARLFGYTFYSDWLISGPDCAATCYFDGLLQYGLFGETANYELATHTRGAEFQFADQINAANLLRFTANYTTAGVSRFNNGSFEAGYAGSRTGVTNLTNGNPSNPQCFSFTTGNQASCFSSSTYGTYQSPTRGQANNPCGTSLLVTSPACVAGATWQVTVPGGQGTFNTVRPVFTSVALEDEFKPNDKLDLTVGLRLENYTYNLQNSNTPEFNFWFNEGAQVNCYDPATQLPMITPLGPGQPVPPAPVQTNPLGPCGTAPSGQEGLHPVGSTALCNGVTKVDCGSLLYSANSPASLSRQMLSPRLGLTYTLSPDDVLRFSAGKFTQPTETAFEQYMDQSGKRAAAFNFTQFWGLGFFTPAHDNPVQYSNNYDGSWEHRFHNSDVTFKLSPFYRDTHNEIVTLVLGPGFVSGTNVGHQHSYGVEFQIQKGDPTRDGLAGMLSYTWTKALLQYGNLPNGTNGIDYLNNYIKAFNGLTSAGGGSPCYQGTTGMACPASFAANPTVVINPYYNMSQQSLLDRNGYYPVYPNEPPNDPFDQGGFSSAIAPHTFSGWLQYKHGRFAIAPNFELVAGGYYGSPTDTMGIDPRACYQNEGAAVGSDGVTPVLPANSPYAGYCDFIAAGASPVTQSGQLAIPNPLTGKMDTEGQFQQPWQLNIGALVRYDVSPRVTANLTLTNLVNRCFGGSSTAWSKAFPANQYVCGYGSNTTGPNNAGFIGTQPGAGFFYGASGADPVNGTTPYAPAFNYPFYPVSGAIPFQAYFEVQVKL